jgi:hypothetical protein
MVKRSADDAEVQLQSAGSKRRSVAESPTSSGEARSDETQFDASTLATATSLPRPSTGAAPCTSMGSCMEAGDSFVHAVCAEQGGRPYQEDTHSRHVCDGAAAYGVFDGHGSSFVSEFCSRHLPSRAAEAAVAAGGTAVASGLRAAFADVDEELARSHPQQSHMCGSTASVVVITRDWLYTANCGEAQGARTAPDRAPTSLSVARFISGSPTPQGCLPMPAQAVPGPSRHPPLPVPLF